LKHLWYILNVKDFAEDSDLANKDEIAAQCAEIKNNPVWTDKIMAAIKKRNDENFFYAYNTASRMDMDISEQLLIIVKENPIESCAYARGLLSKPSVAAELIELYESVLPLDEMATGMGDYYFSDVLLKEHSCLDYILPELKNYPMQGVKLIKTGLGSRVVRERNTACKALSGWVKQQGKPLSDISPELYSEIVRIYEIEVNEHTKERLSKLIDGGFEDE
jgi:hypothetical protein